MVTKTLVTHAHTAPESVVMGLLGNLVKSSVDGVVIELDKGNIPYIVGEKVKCVKILQRLYCSSVPGDRFCSHNNSER